MVFEVQQKFTLKISPVNTIYPILSCTYSLTP